MTTVWGQLAKAQDNAQLITEAIDAAVAAHEADPDSHLGVGESLQSHAASEVIDHLAGSILADKFSNKEAQLLTTFDSVAHWYRYGDIGEDTWPGVVLYTGGSSGPVVLLNNFLSDRGMSFHNSITMLFQSILKIGQSTDTYSAFGLMQADETDTYYGFYFKLVGGVWYACEFMSDVEHVCALSLSTSAIYHNFRIYYDNVLKFVYFFVDGVEVWSRDMSDWTTWKEGAITFTSRSSGMNSSIFTLLNMLFSYAGIG